MVVCLFTSRYPRDECRITAVAANAREIESKQTRMPLECDQSFQVQTQHTAHSLYVVMANELKPTNTFGK